MISVSHQTNLGIESCKLYNEIYTPVLVITSGHLEFSTCYPLVYYSNSLSSELEPDVLSVRATLISSSSLSESFTFIQD